MKLFVPICNNGSGDVKQAWAMCMITELSGPEVNIVGISDSHANRQCNKMAAEFLKTDCDAMLIIDADITFTRRDIARLISHYERGIKLVYGLYPKKQDDAPPCLCTFAELPVPDEHGLAVVRRSGRGFLFAVREIFERLKEDNGGPALRYHNHDEVQWDFFSSGPVTGAYSALSGVDKDGYPKREWLSEDWMLCEHARIHLGIPTLVDTSIALGHIGPKEFRFGAEQLTRVDSNIKSWREIPGWFDYPDLYRDLVKAIPVNGRFVEVGSWLGKSISAFAEYAKEAGKRIEIHAVDTFQGEPANATHAAILGIHGGNVEKAFRANVAACGLNGELTVHAKPSVEAAKEFESESLDAVFIDADHRKEFVMADIEAWLPKVKRGGILAGHDFDEDGVRDAVNELLPAAETVGRCWKVSVV